MVEKDETGAIDSKQFLDAFLYLIIAIGVGTVVSMFLGKLMTFPFYIGAMLVGAVIRNVMDAMQKEIQWKRSEHSAAPVCPFSLDLP